MEEVERVRMPRGKEILGIVEAMLGSSKMRVRCQDNKIRICRVLGKYRKRMWIRIDDAVIIRPWEVQGDERADIVWRYTGTQANWLRRKGVLKI